MDDQPDTRRTYGHWSRDKAGERDGKPGAIRASLYVRQPIDLRSQQQDKTRPACSEMGGVMDVLAVLNFWEGK